MRTEGVDIPIRTTHEGSGIQAAKKGQDELQKELKETAAATREVNAASAASSDEMKKLGAAAEEAAGTKGGKGSGNGLLLLGQAVEDAQYGLRGVMNNIPGLVTSFGLGAGAAGVLQIGLVAVSQVLDIIKAQSKDMAGKPLLGEMTFDEKIMEQSRLFTEELLKQRDALRERNDALRDTVAAADAAMKAEQALTDFRRQVEDEDFVSTGDPIMDAAMRRDTALQRSADDRAQRNKGRAAGVVGARTEQAAREADLASLDRQLAEQKALVDGVKQRAALESALEYAKNPKMKAPGGVAPGDGSLSESIGGQIMSSIPGLAEFLAGRKAIDGATIAGLQGRLDKLPMLPGFQPSGNAEDDEKRRRELYNEEVQRQRELEKARADAAREVESGRRKVGVVEQKAASEDELDSEKTAREQEIIRRKAEAEMAREEQRRRDEAARKASEQQAVDDARAGLRDTARKGVDGDTSRDSPATNAAGDRPEAWAKGMGALDAALGDGEGNASAEVAVIERMRAAMESGKVTRTAALERALREMEALQANGSEMEQRLTSTLSAVASTLQSISSRLSAIEGEVNTINSNRVR